MLSEMPIGLSSMNFGEVTGAKATDDKTAPIVLMECGDTNVVDLRISWPIGCPVLGTG